MSASSPVARTACGLFFGLLFGSCAPAALPDPRGVAREYADAARRGDSRRIYALLSKQARRDYGEAGVQRMVLDAHGELASQGQALTRGPLALEASAEIRFEDGEVARFELEDGTFRLSSMGALPSLPHTPAEALADLRRALARRSYPALVGVLSTEMRSALESDLDSLVEGLEDPATLEVKVNGDTAIVDVPEGHQIKLKREAGIWRVQDFN
ncbi:MAG TPA: hypothetical protein VGI10_26625 [Polyangiaceae bacterium]|jgi:hypothetical protein